MLPEHPLLNKALVREDRETHKHFIVFYIVIFILILLAVFIIMNLRLRSDDTTQRFVYPKHVIILLTLLNTCIAKTLKING